MSRAPEILTVVAADVAAVQDELNRLDGFAGDGDLGVTITAAANAVRGVAQHAAGEKEDLPVLLRACGMEVAKQAPSTCGTLIATGFLRAAAAVSRPAESPTGRLLATLEAALAGIQERGKASVGDKTMLDALAPAVDALRTAAGANVPLIQAVQAAASAAADGARATTRLRPRVGRASWLADRSEGHMDPGAYLVATVLASAARRLGGGDESDKPG
jgi:dihydroxyacetone kinase